MDMSSTATSVFYGGDVETDCLPFVEEIPTSEVKLIEIVGRGAFGVVHRAQWRGKIVAVKILEAENEQKAFTVEAQQLSRVKHPNIIKLYGVVHGPVGLVMEFVEGGSLYNLLHGWENCVSRPEYTAAHVISWALQCALGVEYLHGTKPKSIIHRDLKPPNLLLNHTHTTLKIGDFGTACDLQTYMTNNKGSAAWMAPEVFEGDKYTEKCDVYSFGVILWQMVSRRKPYDDIGGPALRIMWAVHQGTRPPRIKYIPKPLEKLMTSCWDKKPENRSSFSRIVPFLQHFMKFFKDADMPIVFPDKDTASDSEKSSNLSESLVTETHSEPIFPSDTVRELDVERSSDVDDDKIWKSDPCSFQSLAELETGVELLDDSRKELASNTTSGPLHRSLDRGNSSMDDQQVSITTSQAESIVTSSNEVTTATGPESDTPKDYETETRDSRSCPKLAEITVSAGDLSDSTTQVIPSDIFENGSNLNAAENERVDLSVNSSPVPGQVPPHNTPVIGANHSEINPQDVRRALTQAFNGEQTNRQQLTYNEHSFRRSVSDGVYPEKPKDPAVKLRHKSDVTSPSDHRDVFFIPGLDPHLQPVPPVPGVPESMEIFEQHAKMAKEYLELRDEISRKLKKKSELDSELKKYEQEQMSSAKNVEEYSVLLTEQESLKLLRDNLEKELRSKMLRY